MPVTDRVGPIWSFPPPFCAHDWAPFGETKEIFTVQDPKNASKAFPPFRRRRKRKILLCTADILSQKKDPPNRILSNQVWPPPPQSEQEISRAPFQILDPDTRYFLSAWVKIKGRKRKHLCHVFRIVATVSQNTLTDNSTQRSVSLLTWNRKASVPPLFFPFSLLPL